MASLYNNIGLGLSMDVPQHQSFSQNRAPQRPQYQRRRSSGSYERPQVTYQEALRRLPNTTHIPQMPFDQTSYQQMPMQPLPQQQVQQRPMVPAYVHSSQQYAMPRSVNPPQMPFTSPPRRISPHAIQTARSAPSTPHADRRHRATKSINHLSPYPARNYMAFNSSPSRSNPIEENRVPQSYMDQTPVMASPFSDYGHFTHVDSYNSSPVLMESPVFGGDGDDRVAYFDLLEVGMPEEPYVPPMETNFPPRPVIRRTFTETSYASFDAGLNKSTGESLASSPDPEPLAIPSVRRKKTNRYSRWSEEEDAMLRSAINEHGENKWSLVATCVPGRTPMQCSTRWQGALNTTIHKGKWMPDEDAILIKAVGEWQAWHAAENRGISSEVELQEELDKSIPWAHIAATLPRPRTGVQALARWSEALDPRIVKGKWTAEEDAALMRGIQRYGKTWIKVAAAVRGRTQRQCRTRFMQISEKKSKEGKAAIAQLESSPGGWSE